MGAPARALPGTIAERSVEHVDQTQSPWVTIVWDDPVNLMNYVAYVFQQLFGYSETEATNLMLQVHHEGKAVVSCGARESHLFNRCSHRCLRCWTSANRQRPATNWHS